MKRKVAYLMEKGKIEIAENELSHIAEDEVLIRVHSVGICGSDTSYFTKGATGLGKLTYPHVLGHECAGEIVEAGASVKGLQIGDRVTVEPGVPCGTCEYCRSGRYNLCENIAFMSSAIKRPGGEGGMAEYIIRPSSYVYKIPDTMTYDQAALIEPISVAMHAVRRSGIKPGQNAAILGCGPIAGCILLVLHAFGISKVWMTDVVKSRTEHMKMLGACDAYVVNSLSEKELKQLLPEQVSAVFDTTCNEIAVNASISWLKKGGSAVLVGVPSGKMSIDLQAAFAKEVSLVSTFRYANTYLEAISLIAAGKLQPEVLISHQFHFEDTGMAMEKAASRAEDVMKIMIHV